MLDGCSGSSLMPRKIAGNEISTIDESSAAMNMPSVVFDSAVHLYDAARSSTIVASFTLTCTSIYHEVGHLGEKGVAAARLRPELALDVVVKRAMTLLPDPARQHVGIDAHPDH